MKVEEPSNLAGAGELASPAPYECAAPGGVLLNRLDTVLSHAPQRQWARLPLALAHKFSKIAQ